MKISVSGLDETIKRLKSYRDGIGERMHTFLERLTAEGIDTAAVNFHKAQYDGANDVAVDNSPQWIDENRLLICAHGNAVAFIEFGTGVHYSEQHPNAVKVGAARGSFGQGKGSRDSWSYYGEPGTDGKVVRDTEKGTVILTHGNPPARALYDAGKEMRGMISDIAREVFR